MAARLAVLHWVIRLVRRERRQHALVIGLLTFGIASSVVAVSTLVRLNTPLSRELAGAASVVTIEVLDRGSAPAASLPASLARIVAVHPDLEVVARSTGAIEGIALVGQDPTRPLGGRWLRLLEGRWPRNGEITLSTGAIGRLRAAGSAADIGAPVTIAGAARTLVGRYENPTDLDTAEGIVPIAETGSWTQVVVLLPRAADDVTSALLELGTEGAGARDRALPAIGVYQQDREEGSARRASAVFGYVIGTVLCLQIAVLASAGFTVLANRRRRQFGLLAALGAEPAAVGSVMKVTGLVVGVLGGVLGVGAGVVISVAITPVLQRVADFRLSATALGWGYLLPMVPLAVVVAVAAAWWPARKVRHVPAIDAITDRAARRTGVGRSLGLGLALLAAGAVTMKISAPRHDPVPIIGSIIAIIAGVLLQAPASAVVLGRLAPNAPLPIRVAWRDIGRNRTRSAAAIAAAAIAIALPFGVATFAGSYADQWRPVIPTNVAAVTTTGHAAGALAETAAVPDDVRSIGTAVPGTTFVPLVAFVDVDRSERGDVDGFPYQVKNRRRNGEVIGLRTALATPELLQLMGVEQPPAGVDAIVWASGRIEADDHLVVDQRGTKMPDAFPEALLFTPPDGATLDHTLVDTWLVVAQRPFTQPERERLSLATRSHQRADLTLSGGRPPFVAVRAIALALGGLFALAVVAVAVTLIRTENTEDSRVLATVGARPRTTRSIDAATVAGLTVTAAVLAVVASFALLAGIYMNPDENFEFTVPWVELATVLLVVPTIGAAAAWTLASTNLDRLTPRPT